MGFREFILARDAMGHSIGINYKGNGAHTTYVGSMVTLLIFIFVLVQFILSLLDLTEMESPNILSFTRPIYQSENDKFGAINLAEHSFSFGLSFEEDKQPLYIPEEIGRMVTETSAPGNNNYSKSTVPAVKCS